MNLAFDRKELWKQLRRDERVQNRAKVGSLASRVRAATAHRKAVIASAKALCKAERGAARERVKFLREKAKAELVEAVTLEKASAKGVCTAGLGEAQEAKADVNRARDELASEKKFQKDMRRIEAANRGRREKAPRASKREKRSESDDEVLSNIPEELIPLFERVKRSIVGSARMTRTEAFLKYAEEHPEEVIDLSDIDAQTDALVAELERQSRSGRRNPCGCGKSRRAKNNPSRLVMLGKLTEIVWKGGRRRWSESRAPALVYDDAGKLRIVYDARVVGDASHDETREYKRTHWGEPGYGTRESGVTANEPFVELGRGVTITYTTRKGSRELVDWVHTWGDGARGRSWSPPRVVEHVCRVSKCAGSGRIALEGGTYRVTERGIVG